MKESAMAEIYLEDEVLPKDTAKLFDMRGKLRYRESNRCDLMLVLRDNTKLAGYVELRLISDSDSSSTLFALYVHNEYRNRGIGNLLVLHALRVFLNTGESTMSVSYTADSLPLYNKFGFYPPYKEKDELADWFKMDDDQRLAQLKDEPSDYLILDLKVRSCRDIFDGNFRKFQSKSITFELSENLKADLHMNVLAKETAYLTSNTMLLVQSGLGILNTAASQDAKKRKITQDLPEFSSVAKFNIRN
ncbi:GNAT family N-acetyltransferase [Legionella taurinensis]|nr:GNAT family N-acetyltransferase [Legionella taurinensis]RJT48183.1 GNAT family N-acetyltransferase [Legionella taurinensis]RJT69153.1 GNAT family N-acetyltransferase [Legionella taurinensis]STY25923.1 Predicted acetyltransferase [Legionella taurinensis]